MEGQFYTYILECSDGTWYTGWTTDLNRRVAVHNRGQGAKYTRSRLPVKLIYSETFGTKQEAMQREWSIKQLTRGQKESLVRKDKSAAGIERKDASDREAGTVPDRKKESVPGRTEASAPGRKAGTAPGRKAGTAPGRTAEIRTDK